MKLSIASIYFSLVLLLALFFNSYAILEVKGAYENVVKAQSHSKESIALTNDLRIETAQLAQLVRLYTATSEPRYLFYYYDIISIRNGQKSAPVNYNPATYWDDVIAKNQPHLPLDSKGGQSLSNRMEGLGFSQGEIQLFNEILHSLEALGEIEQIAFAATQGLYDVESAEFVSDGVPDLEFANQLVFSGKYNEQKALLSQALDRLSQDVESRTYNEVQRATDRLRSLISRSIVIGITTFVLIFLSYMLFRHYVLHPISLLSNAADKIAEGKYATRVKSVAGAEELIRLGETLNHMSESIEDDIQAREKVHGELERANLRAQEATKAKSMFLANMSHEIRTPMNAIIGMAYLALKTELSPKQANYIETIHNAGQSLLNIINDILDFSKIEAGKIELEQTLFRVEDVVGASLPLIKQNAQNKGIELLFSVKDPFLVGASPSLVGDPVRLGQILNNLLSNAVKFTEKGHILLTVDVVTRDSKGVTLQFSVVDTGIGMSQEQVSRLFREFTQADSSTTRKYGGTGLGLTICKTLVELMDGQLQVESVQGEGSRFTFTANFLLANEAIAFKTINGLVSARVLIIDDMQEACNVLNEMLRAMGVGRDVDQGIDIANSGAEALEKIKHTAETGADYDLILLDWLMPEMDGGEFLNAVNQLEDIHVPEIVIISAQDFELINDSAKQAGVRLFASKPVLPEALRSIFRSLSDADEKDLEPQVSSMERSLLQGMRVLLVEDNRTNQVLAIDLLEMRGITVEVANNGQEALEKVMTHSPDYYHVVLMDLQMPVMDGHEATRRIRSAAEYAELPIIAMTAHAMAEIIEQGSAAGMNGHIAKPILPEQLYDILGSYYRQTAAVLAEPFLQETYSSDESLGGMIITGLDMTRGLQNAAGRADIYLKVLNNFREGFADFPQKMAEALESRNWKEAEISAHSLAGLTGTIGASQITPVARDLEQACKNEDGEKAKSLLERLSAELNPLIFELTTVEPASKPKQVPLKADIRKQIEILKKLLSEGDAEAIEFWEKNYGVLSESLPKFKVSRINQAITHFEFDTALSFLDELK